VTVGTEDLDRPATHNSKAADEMTDRDIELIVEPGDPPKVSWRLAIRDRLAWALQRLMADRIVARRVATPGAAHRPRVEAG
jgi:hypothetical protein